MSLNLYETSLVVTCLDFASTSFTHRNTIHFLLKYLFSVFSLESHLEAFLLFLVKMKGKL